MVTRQCTAWHAVGLCEDSHVYLHIVRWRLPGGRTSNSLLNLCLQSLVGSWREKRILVIVCGWVIKKRNKIYYRGSTSLWHLMKCKIKHVNVSTTYEILLSSSPQLSAWRRARSWLRCLTYPFYDAVILPCCSPELLQLNQTSTRGTTRARWASTSSKSCSQLWMAGSRISWCLTRTGVELSSLMRWVRRSTPWVSLYSWTSRIFH